MVNHPSFEREALKVSREKRNLPQNTNFAQDHDWRLNQEKGFDGR
jgi:hypothetical protein